MVLLQKTNLHAGTGARVGRAVRDGMAITGSGAAGSEAILQLVKNYSRNAGLKQAMTVGIVGYPNVGKSSLINSLKRSKAVGVSSQPGFTKQAQEITLDSKIKLVDCPGVIFEDEFSSHDGGAGLLLRNCISVEAMADPEAAVGGILKRCSISKLMALYNLPSFDDTHTFLELMAQKRGKLMKGGEPNVDAAARSVLQDWNTGKVPFFAAPPRDVALAKDKVSIVAGWAKEFEWEDVFAEEDGRLDLMAEQERSHGSGGRSMGDYVPMVSSDAPANSEAQRYLEAEDDDSVLDSAEEMDEDEESDGEGMSDDDEGDEEADEMGHAAEAYELDVDESAAAGGGGGGARPATRSKMFTAEEMALNKTAQATRKAEKARKKAKKKAGGGAGGAFDFSEYY